MSRVTENKRPWLAYTLYAVVLTLVLLYFLFPSQQVKDFLQAKVENSSSPLHISIGEVSPSLAFGLYLRRTEFSSQTAPDKILLRADRLFVRPGVWTFLQGSFKFCFDSLVNDGSLEGCVRFNKEEAKAPVSASMTFKDIRMDEFKNLSDLFGRQLEGLMGGTVTYSGDPESWTEGVGEADLKLSNGRMDLRQPIADILKLTEGAQDLLDFETVEFKEVGVKMTLKNRKIDLSHVELRGPNIYGTLSGTIRLNRDFLDSSLDLKVTVDPAEGFFESSNGLSVTKKILGEGPLSFRLRGTLDEPIPELN
jgi:type II secretion system protein N